MTTILEEIAAERAKQDAKWDVQNHPWFGPTDTHQLYTPLEAWFTNYDRPRSQEAAKDLVNKTAADGTLGFCDILMEEVMEAIDEADISNVRAELVQIAAVAVAAIESIDRNGR